MNFRHIAILTTLALLPGVGLAQSNSDSKPLSEQESEADQKFFEGKAKARDQKWVEALLLFERSWQLKPSYDSAGNLGQVALKLGLYTKAATYLDRCLSMFPASGSKAQRLRIEGLFREALTQVATIHFAVATDVGELVLDRVTELGPANRPPGAVYVNPGTHIIQLRQGRRVIAEQSFLAVASASQRVQITLASEPEPTLGRSTQPPSNSRSGESEPSSPSGAGQQRGRSLVPIIVGATLGAGSLLAASILLDSANDEMGHAEAIRSQLQAGDRTDRACLDAANSEACRRLHETLVGADRRYNWSYVLFGVGGASALATLTYAVLPLLRSRATAAHSIGAPASLDVRAAQGAVNLTYQGQF